MKGCVCRGAGVVKIGYESGEPFDLAICQCREGQRLRGQHVQHPEWLPMAYKLTPANRIGWVEDFSTTPAELAAWGVAVPAMAALVDFRQAGHVGPKARL